MEKLEREPLYSSELFTVLLETAKQKFEEKELKEIIDKAIPGRFSSSDELLGWAGARDFVPAEFFINLGSLLMKEGLSVHEVIKNIITSHRPPRIFYLNLLISLSLFSSQGSILKPLDLVSSAYLASAEVDYLRTNFVMPDCYLEKVEANRRTLWMSYVLPDQSLVSWFQLAVGHYSLQLIPAIFKEPPAQVTLFPNLDLQIVDKFFPDRPIPATFRPGLRELAARLGMDLSEEGEELYLDGIKFAVKDHHPARVIQKGVYRALHHLRIQDEKAVIDADKKSRPPYKDLVLARDHRFHVDKGLPLVEFIVHYRVRRLPHLVYRLLAEMISRIWKLIAGLESPDPWAELARKFNQPALLANHVSEMERSREELVERNIQAISRRFQLTKREAEILKILAQGKSNKEIADELYISETTVKTHITNILQKTGASSRGRLIAMVYQAEED